MKYIHISKTTVPGSGKTYFNPSTAVRNERKARRCRLISARQQRIQRKLDRSEQKAEAKLNAQIAAHESNMDWQDQDRENNEVERERRAEALYDEHFN